MNINLRPKKCSGQSRYGRYGSYATADCTNECTFQKILTACLWGGGLTHEWKHYIASPTSPPLYVDNNSRFCSTNNDGSAWMHVYYSVVTTNNRYIISVYSVFLLKPSPITRCTRPWSPTRLSIATATMTRPGPTHLTQSWPLWPFCCLYTQLAFTSRHYSLLIAT